MASTEKDNQELRRVIRLMSSKMERNEAILKSF